MPYIGPNPAESFTSFATQTFSVSATTSYTLDHAVANENELALFINNVRQQPGSGKAYTATGTALTLSEATASGDTMYCVFLGRALQTVTPATNSITAAMISDDTITKAKLADQVDIFAGTSLSAADLGAGVHVKTGDSGHGAETHADELVIENDTNGGLTLAMGNSNSATIAFANTNSNEDGKIVYRNNERELRFNTAGSERMRIDSSGSIFIGATGEPSGSTGGVGFSSDTNSRRNIICASTATAARELLEFRNPNGTVGTIQTSGSGTSYNTSSDYRLKENVSYDFDATSRLKQLKPARFNFIADADTTVDGFLAHEVSSIVPEAVSGEKDELQVWEDGENLPEGVSVGDNKLDENGNTIPEYQGIDQSKLVPLMVKTIQELEARIKILEEETE